MIFVMRTCCFLCGRSWIFKCHLEEFWLQRVKNLNQRIFCFVIQRRCRIRRQSKSECCVVSSCGFAVFSESRLDWRIFLRFFFWNLQRRRVAAMSTHTGQKQMRMTRMSLNVSSGIRTHDLTVRKATVIGPFYVIYKFLSITCHTNSFMFSCLK